jgi:hypothetical protein
MDNGGEELLRGMTASLDCDFRSKSPYQMGDVRIEKVGFGETPIVFVIMACPPNSAKAKVLMVRQFIFRELAAAGIGNEILEFDPTIQVGRRVRFIDCNSHSRTKGKKMIGRLYRFAFRIKPPFMGVFSWGGFCNRVGKIPERPCPSC